MVMWALIAVAVVAVIVKRLVGEPLTARGLAVPPLALFGVGCYHLTKVEHWFGVDVGWLVIGSAVGFALGYLRGHTVRVFARDGVLWQRYTPWTLLVWVVSLGINAGVGFLAVHAGAHAEARPMTLSIGLGLLGELIPVGLRALRSGIPFAPEPAR